MENHMKYAASLSLLIIFAIAFIFLRGPQDSLLENQGTSEISAPNEFEHHAINELAEPQRNAVKDEAYTSAIGLAAPKPASEKMLAEHFAGAQAAAAHAKQIKESAMLVRQRSHFIADTDSSMSIAPRDREGYAAKTENRFLSVALSPLSTFGLEVDSASYANMRRQINNGQIPVPASVRLEELVNYFDYNFPAPTGKHPIAVMSDYAVAPWNPAHRIAMIGVKAVDTTASSERGARITFLLDTSGSMNSPNKLPLLNLVILATDGDFNVGASSDGELKAMIEKQRASGVFLSVIGMGTGNYQDAKMQVLAEAGNGVAHYLDSDAEAQRLFGSELSRTLHIAAKDVKVQVEFNPAAVAEYRLLGYESRVMNAEDFRDDKKDSGEIGAGHSVVALYEIIPAGNGTAPDIERRYPTVRSAGSQAMELGFVKIRYKQPDGDKGIEFAHAMTTQAKAIESATADLRWASAVAEFSLVLSQSEHAGSASYAAALRRARAVLPLMPDDKRSEFIGLIERLTTTRIAQE
jgi:hypothetical protein